MIKTKYLDKLIDHIETLSTCLDEQSFNLLDIEFYNFDIKLGVSHENNINKVSGVLDEIYELGLMEFGRLEAFRIVYDSIIKTGSYTVLNERDQFVITISGLYAIGLKRHYLKRCPVNIFTRLTFQDCFLVNDGFIKTFTIIPRSILRPKFKLTPDIWCKLTTMTELRDRIRTKYDGMVLAGFDSFDKEYSRIEKDLFKIEAQLDDITETKSEHIGRLTLNYDGYLSKTLNLN